MILRQVLGELAEDLVEFLKRDSKSWLRTPVVGLCKNSLGKSGPADLLANRTSLISRGPKRPNGKRVNKPNLLKCKIFNRLSKSFLNDRDLQVEDRWLF